jgi:hypothetical protein
MPARSRDRAVVTVCTRFLFVSWARGWAYLLCAFFRARKPDRLPRSDDAALDARYDGDGREFLRKIDVREFRCSARAGVLQPFLDALLTCS